MKNEVRQILLAQESFATAAQVEGKRLAVEKGEKYDDQKHWYQGAEILERRFGKEIAPVLKQLEDIAKAFLDAEIEVARIAQEPEETKKDIGVQPDRLEI